MHQVQWLLQLFLLTPCAVHLGSECKGGKGSYFMMVRCKLYPISLCNAGQDKHRFLNGKVIANTNPRPSAKWKVSERRQAFHKVIYKSLRDK